MVERDSRFEVDGDEPEGVFRAAFVDTGDELFLEGEYERECDDCGDA